MVSLSDIAAMLLWFYLDLKQLPKCGVHGSVVRLPLLPNSASGVQEGGGGGLR